MSDKYIFEYGDPKDMMLPEQFLPSFHGCAADSEEILANRSREEIVSAMRDIDLEISRKSAIPIEGLHHVNESPELESGFVGTCTGRLGIITLMWAHRKEDKSWLSHDIGLTWAEIYAIYTLGLIAYANRDLGIYEQSQELNQNEYLCELAGCYLAEATETWTTASMLESDVHKLKEMQEIVTKAATYKTDRAKSGGEARSQKYRPLEKIVIEQYSKAHSHKSNNQAANDIWRTISEKDKLDESGTLILVEHNAVMTLARWIARYKRQKH